MWHTSTTAILLTAKQAKTLHLVKISYIVVHFVCTRASESIQCHNESCINQKFRFQPNICLMELLIDHAVCSVGTLFIQFSLAGASTII